MRTPSNPNHAIRFCRENPEAAGLALNAIFLAFEAVSLEKLNTSEQFAQLVNAEQRNAIASHPSVRRCAEEKAANYKRFTEAMKHFPKTGKKRFYTMRNVGSSKYSVHCHDGIDTHRDGSPFYDIRLFRNKKKYEKHIKELIADGYTERSFNEQ